MVSSLPMSHVTRCVRGQVIYLADTVELVFEWLFVDSGRFRIRSDVFFGLCCSYFMRRRQCALVLLDWFGSVIKSLNSSPFWLTVAFMQYPVICVIGCSSSLFFLVLQCTVKPLRSDSDITRFHHARTESIGSVARGYTAQGQSPSIELYARQCMFQCHLARDWDGGFVQTSVGLSSS